MRHLAPALLLLAPACASPSSADGADEPRVNRISLHLGTRGMNGSDWDPVEDEGVGGLEFVHEAPGSVVGIEAAFFAGERTEDDFFVPPAQRVDYRSRTAELSFGVHKELPVQYSGVHPYFGGGLSALNAELRGPENGAEREQDGDSVGLYLHGGVEFDASSALFLGIDLRLRGGSEVHLLGEDRDTGYGQVAFVLGVRF